MRVLACFFQHLLSWKMKNIQKQVSVIVSDTRQLLLLRRFLLFFAIGWNMILNAFHGVSYSMKDYRNIVFFAVFYVFFCKYGVFYILIISIPIRAESFEKPHSYDCNNDKAVYSHITTTWYFYSHSATTKGLFIVM